MSEASISREISKPAHRTVFLVLLVLASLAIAVISLLVPVYARLSASELQLGEVATEDILAPSTTTYISEVRTEMQRETAARAVQPVYSPSDASVARHQLERLRVALAFISSVRADTHATPEQQVADLTALESIHLDQETAQSILALSDNRWQTVQSEAIVVLEQVMRDTIREDRLEEVRRSVPARVPLALPEEQAAMVADLVAGFIAPNSFYSESLTEAARQQAREAVAPVSQSYVVGETIAQRGRVITATDLEALEQFGMRQPQSGWQDVLSAFSLVALMAVFILLYLNQRPILVQDLRGLALIAVLFSVFLFVARLTITDYTVVPYIYPLAAFSLVVATLFGVEVALIFTFPLAILFAYNMPNALDLTLYFLMSGSIGVLTLGRARRLASFFWAGAAIAVSGAIVIIAFRLPENSTNWFATLNLIGASLLNGIASAGLSVILQFLLAQFLGLTTALQLMEVSRPDNTLLQFILRSAPGTYQHSLQVANLSEQAAEQVGADPLLTRVGALYHDAGKALNPFYFIENQVPGSINPHDQLDPESSAIAIIRHVTDGLDLARKYRLPSRIRDFIAEHHGTMITRYQYVQAVEAAGGNEDEVDVEKFRYPGPRPQSRETAILMLADGTEARVRAERPKDETELRSLVKSVIENRIKTGELDDTDLTLHDLDRIADTFTATLRGIYHPRIVYPKLDSVAVPRKDESITKPVEAAPEASDVPISPEVEPVERS